ncbi:CoA transferase (plasmid) [Salinigranum rubrum]|uniref:CoA transferase n=1 Tax=Salinigranum rubrum TaxID=755307 RepID=A0A2I8VS20_9EURY|nr:CaiB/BaiF CoA-transferase family protein [Salinigranum rubrum]AUV84654.1 CoA transferase [Salinigranum rubrum]
MDLQSIRVLDLSHTLPGPYGTQLLCDMGADVIKIERPETGEPGRQLGRTQTDRRHAPVFEVMNRGKRSVTLDLKRERGLDAFLELARTADVLVEQFRPGVVDRLGVAYDDMCTVNDEIVYCSLSGFGQTGPLSERVGHDLNYAGFAGLIDMNRRDPETKPTLPGFPVADMAGGAFAALSIVGALLSRELGEGDGEYLDVSMTDALLSFSQLLAAPAMAGVEQRPGATRTTGKYPCYDVYETADGRYVTLAALEPEFWQRFCELIDRPDLVSDHKSNDETTRKRLRNDLSAVFTQRSAEEWETLLGDEDVMFGPVQTLAEAFESDHFEARGVIESDDGLLKRIGFPAITNRDLGQIESAPPALGEHTDEVLQEVGFSAAEVATLHEQDVV